MSVGREQVQVFQAGSVAKFVHYYQRKVEFSYKAISNIGLVSVFTIVVGPSDVYERTVKIQLRSGLNYVCVACHVATSTRIKAA